MLREKVVSEFGPSHSRFHRSFSAGCTLIPKRSFEKDSGSRPRATGSETRGETEWSLWMRPSCRGSGWRRTQLRFDVRLGMLRGELRFPAADCGWQDALLDRRGGVLLRTGEEVLLPGKFIAQYNLVNRPGDRKPVFNSGIGC